MESIKKHLFQFHLPGDKLGSTKEVQHKIETTDNVPVNSKYPRYPEVHKEEIKKQTEALLKNDSIKVSKSPYNSPVWIIPKKEDSQGNKRWRMVIDDRKLNEKTIGDYYPLPNITDILDQLGGGKYFTVLDLAQGFHQVEVAPEDRYKTAFSTPYGHYEVKRMPFGLKNSPSTFQRMMDRVLSGMQGIELFVYMDDIVIYANSLKEHREKFEKLLGRLKSAGLVLEPDKCKFLCKEIGYLGHIISKDGVRPDPKKLEAVSKFPQPKNRRNIKQFLGLAGYYRKFIPNFAKIAKPLTNLLKIENKFNWGLEAEAAFNQLKEKLCTQPLLQYPDFKKPSILTTDASDYAVGAVLSHGEIGKDLPISYASRTQNDAETRYSTTEKELLAIVFAVKYFIPYLYGTTFKIVTDHQALVWLSRLKDPTINSRIAKWKIKLQDYKHEIVFRPGRVNANADALSRNPVPENKILELKGKLINVNDNENGEEDQSDRLYDEYPIERLFIVSKGNVDVGNMELSGVNKDSSVEWPRECDGQRHGVDRLEIPSVLQVITPVGTGTTLPSDLNTNGGKDDPGQVRTHQLPDLLNMGEDRRVDVLGSDRNNVLGSDRNNVLSSDGNNVLGSDGNNVLRHLSLESGTRCRSLKRQYPYVKTEDMSISKIRKIVDYDDSDDSDGSEIFEKECNDIFGMKEDCWRGAFVMITPGSFREDDIVSGLFQNSNEKLWMREDHILNFMSVDCVVKNRQSRELLEL